MAVQSLTTAIKTRVQSVLGNTYSEIGYALDVSKNTFKGNDKRFGVLPKGAIEQSGVIGYVTIEQDFEIILTDGFINKPLTDAAQQAKIIALKDLILGIYADLVKTKCGSNTCITVRDLSISDSQFLDKENVMIQAATIKVKYRTQL